MDEAGTDYLEKRKRLQEAGLHVVSVPGEKGQVDLGRLMELLGGGDIPGIGAVDSILLEGGGKMCIRDRRGAERGPSGSAPRQFQ